MWRKFGVQVTFMGCESYPLTTTFAPERRFSEPEDVSQIWTQLPRQAAQECSFAGTVGPEQSHDFATRDRQIDMIQDALVAHHLVQISRLERIHMLFTPPSAGWLVLFLVAALSRHNLLL